jgi:hypothetical protein
LPNEAKQRFLDLDVGEISLVDTPAIEREILVMKRLEEEPMGTETTVTETQKEKDGGAEVVAVDVETTSADDAAVTKALGNVASIVENIAKAAGVSMPVKKEDSTPVADESADASSAEDVDTEKAKKGMREMYKAQLTKAGISGEAMTKAMAEYDKAFPPFPPASKTTTKSVEPQPSVEELEEQEAVKALTLLEQAVSKAKRFTPARVAELQKAVEALQKLLAVVDVPQGASPKTSAPSNTMFGGSGVQELTKAIEQLTSTVTKSMEGQVALKERIETIEKSRMPAQALDGEETATTTETTEKSFWAGVL